MSAHDHADSHDHADPHDHDHDHGHHEHHHHHHHGPANYDRAFAFSAAINLAFVILEAGYGYVANSVALMADAAHNFGDVLSLLLGWGAAWLSRRPPSDRRTYGWGRSSILAALFNAAVLLVSVGAIGLEAIRRLLDPAPVSAGIVMIVAAIGIVVNGGPALLFMRGRKDDLNIRAQFIHLGGDALVSLGVVFAAIAIYFTGWSWLDPAASLIVAGVITFGTWGLLRESVDLAMDAVPDRVRQDKVRDWLASLPGVAEVHDLHIWGISTTETALTAHLVCHDGADNRRLHELSAELRQRFGIGHSTVQIESQDDAAQCRLRPDSVV